MATQVHKVTSQKQKIRFKRKKKIRSRIEGSLERPRLSVFRSNRHIYVQIVDDVKGHTLASACSLEEELKEKVGGTIEGAKTLGGLVAKRALAKNISQVVFDRSGYLYHGRIKAVADAAREGGLKFKLGSRFSGARRKIMAFGQAVGRQQEESEFEDKVIHINRCAKVVKGGRRFSFAAIVVVGDKKGRVGIGLGKAGEVPEAIKKAGKQAKKNLMKIPMEGNTIPHQVTGRFGASQVLMKPAPEGTGIIASSSVRAILEVAGIQNILTKSIRRDNPHNVVKATLAGLKGLRNFADIAKGRNKTVGEIL